MIYIACHFSNVKIDYLLVHKDVKTFPIKRIDDFSFEINLTLFQKNQLIEAMYQCDKSLLFCCCCKANICILRSLGSLSIGFIWIVRKVHFYQILFIWFTRKHEKENQVSILGKSFPHKRCNKMIESEMIL